ncbi:Phosphatidylinositol 3 [Diplonema papillatum]|nr:Phosphatidylinositol 3 [Diplonema papillatum]
MASKMSPNNKKDKAGSPSGEKGGLLTSKLRGMVSMKKVRFQEDGYDLDLTYITPRMIAMGFPSSGTEGLYRNPVDEVERFFNTRHKDHYRVYNLCSERKYDKDGRFDGRYKRFPFDDHNAPAPISIMSSFIDDVNTFLAEDDSNVVAVHCKAGKGRTGVLVTAYLMATESEYADPQVALDHFAALRTNDGKGVTIPSQHRYVGYWHNMLRMYKGKAPPSPPLKLDNITVSGGAKWDLYITILQGPERQGIDPETVFDTKQPIGFKKAVTGNGTYSFDLRRFNVIVRGDVKVIFKKKKLTGEEHLFHYWFHTAFTEVGEHAYDKAHLDKAVKDIPKHAIFKADLSVKMDISEAPEEFRKRGDSAFFAGNPIGDDTEDVASPTASVKAAEEKRVKDVVKPVADDDDDDDDAQTASSPSGNLADSKRATSIPPPLTERGSQPPQPAAHPVPSTEAPSPAQPAPSTEAPSPAQPAPSTEAPSPALPAPSTEAPSLAQPSAQPAVEPEASKPQEPPPPSASGPPQNQQQDAAPSPPRPGPPATPTYDIVAAPTAADSSPSAASPKQETPAEKRLRELREKREKRQQEREADRLKREEERKQAEDKRKEDAAAREQEREERRLKREEGRKTASQPAAAAQPAAAGLQATADEPAATSATTPAAGESTLQGVEGDVRPGTASQPDVAAPAPTIPEAKTLPATELPQRGHDVVRAAKPASERKGDKSYVAFNRDDYRATATSGGNEPSTEVVNLALGIVKRVKALEATCSLAIKRSNLSSKALDVQREDFTNMPLALVALSVLQRSSRLEIVCAQEKDYRALRSQFRELVRGFRRPRP